MSSDLDAFIAAISGTPSLKLYRPDEREAEAAKIRRLRQLRLAAATSIKPRRRKGVKTVPIIVVSR